MQSKALNVNVMAPPVRHHALGGDVIEAKVGHILLLLVKNASMIKLHMDVHADLSVVPLFAHQGRMYKQ